MQFSNNSFLDDNKNVKKVLAFISEKDFQTGERLPSERELSHLIGIGRNSLREALKVLEAIGLLDIQHGSGVYLRHTDLLQKGNDTAWLLINKDEVLNMITVREALEVRAIDLIPESDYPRIHTALRESIRKLRERGITSESLLDHDMEFHNIIRRATNNEILLKICVALTENIYDERRVLFSDLERAEKSLQEHVLISNAFGTGDYNEIKLACVSHMVSTRASIESVLSSKN